jgi:battenin
LVQVIVLATAILESTRSLFTSAVGPGYAIGACFLLIALEGLCGGLAYCNVYLRVGLIEEEDEETVSRGEVLARREFRIACVGFADTLGILAARWAGYVFPQFRVLVIRALLTCSPCLSSLVSSWLEPTLCSCESIGA